MFIKDCILKTILLIITVVFSTLLFSGNGKGSAKINICHLPPGNTSNLQLITISEKSFIHCSVPASVNFYGKVW